MNELHKGSVLEAQHSFRSLRHRTYTIIVGLVDIFCNGEMTSVKLFIINVNVKRLQDLLEGDFLSVLSNIFTSADPFLQHNSRKNFGSMNALNDFEQHCVVLR